MYLIVGSAVRNNCGNICSQLTLVQPIMSHIIELLRSINQFSYKFIYCRMFETISEVPLGLELMVGVGMF